VSPHEALLSASGLRPMSAFVVVGAVVMAVAVWVARLAAGDAVQPDRARHEESEPPAYSIVSRDGDPIARFVPRFDLELSPRSLWQAHTPRRMAEALAGVLGGEPSARELLAAMLPDADEEGRIRVSAWELTLRQAQRVADWIATGAGTERGPLEGIHLDPLGPQRFQLVWEPEVLLTVTALPRRLSRGDRLSFHVCRENDWICLTNDRPLRRICEEHGVRAQWGLELMAELASAGALSRSRALGTARRIRENNPHHISEAIVKRFAARLGRVE